MPTIPKAERQVQRTALRGVQQQGASQEAFGASIGSAINSTGNVVSEIALDQLATQNETKTKELDVEFSQSLRAMQFDPKSGYYNKRGKDAYDYQPIFQQATVELSKQFLDRTENESQRAMLTKVMDQRVARAQDGVARHAFKEYNSWIDNAALARADDLAQDAILNHNNASLRKDLMNSGRAEIQITGQRQGKSQPAIKDDLDAYTSGVHEGSVELLMQQDVKAARAYYEANEDEIDVGKRAKLLRGLKVAEKGALATNLDDYGKLMRMYATNRSAFIATDLNEYELSAEDQKAFESKKYNAQTKLDKYSEDQSDVINAMKVSRKVIEGSGIKLSGKGANTKTNKKRISELEAAIAIKITRFKKINGTAPNDAEIRKIALSLTAELTRPDDWSILRPFGAEDKSRAFEGKGGVVDVNDIPERHLAKLKSQLKERFKREATSSELEKYYTRWLFNLKRKTK